jgi:DNA-binding SARP family transcriptional activator/transcriptional regulator with XRE-family HTH domain/tetratricopeptide (TPR) repeat protein
MERWGGGRESRFGVLVRKYRRDMGLTQQELAAKAGLSVAALRDIEQFRRCRPRAGTLNALIDALGLDGKRAADLISSSREMAASQRAPLADSAPAAGPEVARQGPWLTVLGPLETWRDGAQLSAGPAARRAVLGLLLMNPGVLVSRDAIVDALWEASPPRTAVGLVQAHVSRLRRVLQARKDSADGHGMIDSVQGGYRLNLSVNEVDLLLFRDLATRAGAARGRDDAGACDLYERAIGLWRGEPLADVTMLQGHPGIALLRQELGDVLLRYADVAFALAEYHRVLPRLLALAVAEPLNESAHARLMIALAGSGQQAAAIRVYEDLRARLDRELALYPGEELAQAHVRVLRQDMPAGERRGRHAPAPAAPWVPRQLSAASWVPRQLPAAARYFSGRDDVLDNLSALLKRDTDVTGGMVIAALTGMGGIGKTALAVHWAHRTADQFPDGQLFVDLHGFSPSKMPLAPSEAMYGFLSSFDVPASRIPEDLAGRVALFRSLVVGKRMLIVLDNAQDADQVRPLLPGSPGCFVLVTSRNRLTGLAASDGAHLLALGVLSETESCDLVARHLGAARVMAEPAAVSELIAWCGRLPLALCDVAARAASRPGLPLSALAAEMRDERQRLDALETGESATSVRMAFSLSRMRLGGLACRMFRLLGIHAGPDITVPAAASLAGVERNQAQLALVELCDEHLLTEHALGRYACHDLLRAYAVERSFIADAADDRRDALHRVLDHYLHTASVAATVLSPCYAPLTQDRPRPGVQPEEIDSPGQAAQWFEDERHVLIAAVGQAAEKGYAPHAWELPWTAGMYYSGDAYWRKLAEAQETALAVATRLDDEAGQVLARQHLGLLRFRLGQHQTADLHMREAMELADELPDSRLRAMLGLTLSYVLDSQHRTLEALLHAGQSLRLHRAMEDRRGEMHALNALSWHWTQLGGHQQAAVYRGQAEALLQRPAIDCANPHD